MDCFYKKKVSGIFLKISYKKGYVHIHGTILFTLINQPDRYIGLYDTQGWRSVFKSGGAPAKKGHFLYLKGAPTKGNLKMKNYNLWKLFRDYHEDVLSTWSMKLLHHHSLLSCVMV